jgi:dephospho-CoA kinase
MDSASGKRVFEVWGLTGGVAAGKSQAARFFAEAGIPVLDADALARELSSPGGAAHDMIARRFGTADRHRLREIVFGDPAARRDLEAILHPLIVAESLRRMEALAQAAVSDRLAANPYAGNKKVRVIYEAALLVETGRHRELDGLLVVDAPADLRRQRLIAREGIAPELADRIIAAQISDDERRAVATALIPNTGTLDELRQAVGEWIARSGWL